MRVFLSSNRGDAFFIGAVKQAVGELNGKLGPGIVDLVYPPEGLGIDSGKILTNVLEIIRSDVVLLNVSPERIGDKAVTNSGVLIEYGIVLGQHSVPTAKRLPEPIYRIFCGDDFHRSDLGPLMSQEDVIPFSREEAGKVELTQRVVKLIQSKIDERLTIDFNKLPTGFPPQ